jgi:hypothetical protein
MRSSGPIKLLAGSATVAVIILTAPAHAGIRAEYGYGSDDPPLVVEVADNGDARITSDGYGYFIIVNGEGYWVEPGPGGPIATAEDARAQLAARERRDSDAFEASIDAEIDEATRAAAEEVARKALAELDASLPELGTESAKPDEPDGAHEADANEGGNQTEFAGWQGAVLPLPEAPDLRMVVTEAVEIAPLGAAIVQYLAASEGLAADSLRPSEPSPLAGRREALHGKTPLAYGRLTLRSISFGPIAADRFALPADVVGLEDLPPDNGPPDFASPPEPSIVQAVFADAALWTLDDDGKLKRTPDGGQQRTPVDTPEPAIAICRAATSLWLVTRSGQSAPLRLWTRDSAGQWARQIEVSVSPRASAFGVECSGDRPLVFLGDKVVMADGGRALRLDPEQAGPSGFSTLLRMGDVLYVGSNAGEWGGGLLRIDLATGESSLVQSGNVEESCGGLLNASCDPVTGLAPDPALPTCVLAAVGLVHFLAHGEVVRVCGTEIERVYRKPYTIDPNWDTQDAEEAASTVPFFGLAGRGDQVWGIAADGIYRFGEIGEPEIARFPRHRPKGIDWSHPDVIIVPTDMNRRHSLSGGSQLLVLR